MNHRAAAQSVHQVTGWRKSSHSKGENDCVEVGGAADGWVGVRDSKLGAAGSVLLVLTDSWRGLLAGLRGSRP